MPPDNVASSHEFGLLSCANEGKVNEGWLLANLRPGVSPPSSAQDPQVSVLDDSGPAPVHNEGDGERALDPDPSEVPSVQTPPQRSLFSMDQESSVLPSAGTTPHPSPSPMDLDPGINLQYVCIVSLTDNTSRQPREGSHTQSHR